MGGRPFISRAHTHFFCTSVFLPAAPSYQLHSFSNPDSDPPKLFKATRRRGEEVCTTIRALTQPQPRTGGQQRPVAICHATARRDDTDLSCPETTGVFYV